MRLKMTIAGLVVAVAVSYLAFAGVKSGWVYCLPVDQFAKDSQYHSQRVRLTGKVSGEGLVSNPAGLTANFNLKGLKSGNVKVVYHGAVPDLFKADCDVLVEGKLDSAGVFQADVLMTKCASKYESGEQCPTSHGEETK